MESSRALVSNSIWKTLNLTHLSPLPSGERAKVPLTETVDDYATVGSPPSV
jgi:hypothetical protein